ncbi:cag isoform X2 [Megachile rotundata]|uniref:cag isoform X2 n=1 Tax=Megachile rotundata TaxID=143995 RepID=UPI003FD067E6
MDFKHLKGRTIEFRLKYVWEKEKVTHVAAELGVGTSTIFDWKKKTERMLKIFVPRWYIEEVENGIPIPGPALTKKALSLNKMLVHSN